MRHSKETVVLINNQGFYTSLCWFSLPAPEPVLSLLYLTDGFRVWIEGGYRMRNVTISSELIELNKLLKFEGLVGSGGEANEAITEGLVSVNGEIETRKRKKIVAGDIVAFGNEKMLIQKG